MKTWCLFLTLALASGPAWADKKLDEAVAKAEAELAKGAKGKGEEALKGVEKLTLQSPPSLEAHVALARLQDRIGKADEAAATVAKGLQADTAAAAPIRADALALQSALDLRRGTGKDALAHAQQAVEIESNPKTLAALARAQARAGRPEALATAEKAVEGAGATVAAAHDAKGKALLAAGRPADAVTSLRKAVELEPTYVPARVHLADALIAAGKAPEAVIEARKATEEFPQSGEAFAMLGAAIIAENPKAWAAAIEQAQQGAFLAPKSPLVNHTVGKIFEAGGNLDQATASYKRALEIDPGHPGARVALVTAQVMRGDVDQALVAARALVKELPQNAQGQYLLGRILLAKGQYAEAVPALEIGADALSGNADVHAQLGSAYQLTGRPTEALTEFKQAVELDPKNLEYRTAYGALLGMAKQANEAIAELTKVIQTPGYKGAEAYVQLGATYRRADKNTESIGAYKKALEIDPKSAPAAMGIAWTYYNAKAWAEAIAAFNKAAEIEPKMAGEACIGVASSQLWAVVDKKQRDASEAKATLQKCKTSARADDPRIQKLEATIAQVEKGGQAGPQKPVDDDGPDCNSMIARSRSNSPGDRKAAAKGLLACGAGGVPALQYLLTDADAGVRTSAAVSLGQIGAPAKGALPILKEEMLKSQERIFRPEGPNQTVEQQTQVLLREQAFQNAAREALQKLSK